jgi:hypothetical protein
MIGVIVGNGPSLNDIPLAFLRKYQTIGSNLIYLHDQFTPTFYTAVDTAGLPAHYAERVNEMACIKIVSSKVAKFGLTNCLTVATHGKCLFSENLFRQPLNEGWNILFVNLQLAYYLNWQTVLLVGFDWTMGALNSHFHKDYSNKTYVFDESKVLPYLRTARFIYERDGRKIINLTPESKLRVFEQGKIEEWL